MRQQYEHRLPENLSKLSRREKTRTILCARGESCYLPNLVNWIAPARRSQEEFDDKLDVDGDGRRFNVLTK